MNYNKMVKSTLNTSKILIKPSNKLTDHIAKITCKNDIPYNIIKMLHENQQNPEQTTPKQNKYILDLDDIQWLHDNITKDDQYFHELFEGSEIILPENDELARNQDLELRCRQLEAQQLNVDYNKMIDGTDNNPEDSVAFQLKQMNKQLLVVVQFIASIVAGFLFGFLGVELMVGGLDLGFRLLTGIVCAVIVALAELYFMIRSFNNDVMHRKFEGRYSIKLQ